MQLPFVSRKTPWQLLLVFLILAIFISSAGLIYYQSQKKEIKKNVEEELLAISNLKLSQIVNWRKERLADAATIRDNFLIAPYVQGLIRDPKGAKGKKELLSWMKSFKETFQYEDILLLSRAGIVLLSVSQRSEVIGAAASKLVSGAVKTRKTIFSDLYKGEVTDKVRLDIAVPILNDNKDDILGVILLRMDPDNFLFPLIETWPTSSPTAETMLVRREGDDVIYLNNLRHQKGTALTLRLSISQPRLPAAMVVRGKEGILEGIDYRGTEVLAAVRSIPNSPWAIVSKVDKEEIYAPIRQRLWNVMLVIGLSIFSSGIGVLLLWRRREREEQRAYLHHLEDTVKKRTAELEQANNQLQESYKDLESFSYSVSHDLRQPLIVIEGFARNLLKRYAESLDDNGKENLSIIRDQARKMTRFINDLLSFCRASTKEVQKSDVDMNVLAHDIVEEMKKTISERSVQFVIHDLPIVWGDPSMIRQALVNLLSNALKYSRTREIAKIEIGGAEKEEANMYYVKDNGVGFDSDSTDKLFSLFNRLHSPQEFEGTGIGLVITKRIINKHGGRVWAGGKVNEGATFYFTLPRKP
jgi:signal transduction histidine kinase